MKHLKTYKLFESSVKEESAEEIYALLKRDCPKYLAMLKSCYTDNTENYNLDFEDELFEYFDKEIPMLYRGSEKLVSGNIEEREARKDRWSKDTKQEISDEIDDVFQAKYNIKPRREGVFSTSSFKSAGHYGDEYMFFPMGDFKFIWSKDIDDLNDELMNPANKLYSWYMWIDSEHYRKHKIDGEAREKFELNHQLSVPKINGKEVTMDEVNRFKEKFEKEMNISMASEKKKWMDTIVDRYLVDEDLCGAIGHKNEITFICDYYYLVKNAMSGALEDRKDFELKKLIFDIDIEIPKDI